MHVDSYLGLSLHEAHWDNPRIVQAILGLRVKRSNLRFAQTILGLSGFEVCAKHILYVILCANHEYGLT